MKLWVDINRALRIASRLLGKEVPRERWPWQVRFRIRLWNTTEHIKHPIDWVLYRWRLWRIQRLENILSRKRQAEGQ